MITTTPEVGGSTQPQVAMDSRSAPKHAVRTTQATTPQAVPRAEARGHAQPNPQAQDSGIQLQISGQKGAQAQQALTRIAQPATQSNGLATAERNSDKPNDSGQPSNHAATQASGVIDNDQLKEVVEKLEDEERERKERAKEIELTKKNYTDTSPGSTPEETIQKARILRSKAMTTSQNDTEGTKLAAKAAQMESEAKAKITQRQREAAGIQIDPVDLMERSHSNRRDSSILDKIGSTYARMGHYKPSQLVSVFA